MGYSTDFTGKFKFNKTLDLDTFTFLTKLSETRRMKRNVDAKYGVEGEFFVDGQGFAGQDKDKTVIDQNSPPRTQPGLWLQWVPTKDGMYYEWSGAEKFYSYIEWLQYVIDKILKPRGYSLEGVVHWTGEDEKDIGTIQICGTEILTEEGVHKTELRPNSTRLIGALSQEEDAVEVTRGVLAKMKKEKKCQSTRTRSQK